MNWYAIRNAGTLIAILALAGSFFYLGSRGVKKEACVTEPVKEVVPVPEVGACYRPSHAYYAKSGPFYKIKEVGTVSALLEFRKTYGKKVDAEVVYTFGEIHRNFNKIDCLGELK